MAVRNAETIAVGDVIRSPRFEFGRTDPAYGNILVGAESLFVRDDREKAETVRRGFEFTDSSDATRRDALFQVYFMELRGGQSLETWFNFGRYVKAQRLGPDGSADPNGEKIAFLMSGPFDGLIPEVEVVGRIVTRMEPLPVTESVQG